MTFPISGIAQSNLRKLKSKNWNVTNFAKLIKFRAPVRCLHILEGTLVYKCAYKHTLTKKEETITAKRAFISAVHV